MGEFLKFIQLQQLLTVCLCPIQDCLVFDEKYNDVNVYPVDLNIITRLGEKIQSKISSTNTPFLYSTLRHLQGIVCEISESSGLELNAPHNFIEAMMLQVGDGSTNEAAEREEQQRKNILDQVDKKFNSFLITLLNDKSGKEELHQAFLPLTNFTYSQKGLKHMSLLIRAQPFF